MESVPFRVIDANALTMERQGGWSQARTGRSWVPGAVDHSEASVWTSNSHAPYPQELGLQVLSKSHYTIRSLRVVAKRGATPSKIELLYATETEQNNSKSSGRHDPVSRYFSARFTSCSEPLEWLRSASSGCEQRMIRVELRHCVFLKLLVHPSLSSGNQVVCIQEIELLGAFESTEAPSRRFFTSVAADSMRATLVENQPLCTEIYEDELHCALLEAGVSLDIVTRVLALPAGDHIGPHGDGMAGQPATELDNFEKYDRPNSFEVHIPLPSSPAEGFYTNFAPVSSLVNEDESIFDSAIRHELLRVAEQDQLVSDIVIQSGSHPAAIACRLDSSPSFDSGSLLKLGISLPTISPHDRGNLMEIVMYTFGNLFAECLCCEAPYVRALTISTAERFLGSLRAVMGSVVAFEGAMALLRLSLQDSVPHAFQASVHLAQTIFEQKAGFMDDIPDGSVVLGLRYATETLLGNQCCWASNWTQTPASQRSKISGGKRRISLDLLKLVRMLIAQEKTQLSFYRVLLSVNNTRSSSNQSRPDNCIEDTQNLASTGNRLRLIRLLLQRHRAQLLRIPSQVLRNMKIYCEEIQDAASISSNREHSRLAGECFVLLLHSNSEKNGKSKQLAGIYASANEFETAGSETLEEPAVSHISFTAEQSQQYHKQTRRYFQARPRPRSLYRHTFDEESLSSDSVNNRVSFQKGNIGFRGNIEQREFDKVFFHESLELNTKPFVFESSALTHEVRQVKEEISTSFAKFRGTLEKRGALLNAGLSTVGNIGQQAPSSVLEPDTSKKRSDKPTSEVAPNVTAAHAVSTEAVSLRRAVDPMETVSSMRRIASVSLSRRSIGVADLVQPLPPQATLVSSSAPQKTTPGHQHPRTAPAGNQMLKAGSNGDANPPGCVLQ